MTSPSSTRRASRSRSRTKGEASRPASARRSKEPSFVPARREGSPARRRLERGQRRAGSSENGEVNERDDPETEQERVALNVADLEEAKGRTETPGGGAGAADRRAVQNPAIDERAQLGEEFLGGTDQEPI